MNTRINSDLLESERYRTLLGVSTSLAAQPDVGAALGSISGLLSKVVSFNSIALLLLSQDRETAKLYALESGIHDNGFEIGSEVPFKDTAIASALETQRPVFVPDIRTEMSKIPQLVERVHIGELRSSYIFPILSARGNTGVLIFGAAAREKYSEADVELMSSVTAHVAALVDSAIALECAKAYKQELERERDRLKLLLEINNYTVTHLDVNELFCAASSSIRKFFKSEFTGFWLLDEASNRCQCVTVDFPDSRGYIENLTPTKVTVADLESIRARVPTVLDRDEVEALPEEIKRLLRAESIMSLAGIPLMGSRDPLGFISLGSRQKNAFNQPDLDLLLQVGNQISMALDNALAYGRMNVSHKRLEDERHYLESEIQSEYNFEDIVGKSKALKKVLEQVAIVAPTDSTVLLIGETGTGKELIARAIHNLSVRVDRTFVRLNCAAVPSGLMESELFGHERGAFTGALMQKRGRIELAHEGSLFLDEVGDIDPELQPKLLRVLQEREFERLGSNRTIKVDIRLIAATHRDLPAMVRNGEFREDFYYRLNVFPIHVPPLRDRREDIPLLVHYFVALLSRKMRKSIRIIPQDVMKAMSDWQWPGNVRELQNFVERSVILTRDEVLAAPISELNQNVLPQDSSGAVTLDEAEREAIVRAIRLARGKISGAGGAAERLGLRRTTLQSKMRRLGISK